MADLKPELPAAYELVYYETIPDLRIEARRLCDQGAGEGTLLWAAHQSSPRGRNGKTWHTSPGDLHCSIILRPEFTAHKYPQILLVAALSLGNALATHLSPMISLAYGWPDDIRIAGHKAAGIWIDCNPESDEPWLCVTASVNIRNSPQDSSIPAISILEAEGSTELDSRQLLETYARQFISQINLWSEDGGMQKLVRQWQIRAEDLGKITTLHLQNDSVAGVFEGLDEDGNVLLKMENGTTRMIVLSELTDCID